MTVRRAAPDDRQAWDAFVRRSPTGSFLQSWAWGTFQERAGFRISRLLVASDGAPGDIRAAGLFVERPMPFARHAVYAPWGPVVGAPDVAARGPACVRDVLRQIAAHVAARDDRPIFLRVELRVPRGPEILSALAEAGFTPLHRGVQPMDTRVVDLDPSDDDLLRQMRPKTRYNIRVASRNGVTVEEDTSPRGLRVFRCLAEEAERRGRFRYHPAAYYAAMLETLGAERMLRILIARHKGMPLVAGLFISFGDTVTYAHGASSKNRSHVMAPYLLHWEALREAKSRGARRYDFFGIAPRTSVSHSWAGITRFKRGFGGAEQHFPGVADAVFDPLRYRFLRVARGARLLFHPRR